ncbi:MAG TPA: hypothetical protein VIG06_07565 [Kofleriaceae bacterium]|jgi:hypothetical protein
MNRIAGVLLALAGACGGVGADGTRPLDELDEDTYARDVHPIIEARCATLDCHGVEDRPLRLYSETGLRARDDLRDQPIERDELVANVRAIAAIEPGASPAETLFIRKPLAGGVFHEGGDLWSSRDEPQLVCALAWLEGASDEPAAAEACAIAADEVALPPPMP